MSSTSEVADLAGVARRPHCKTHKMPWLAKLQIRAGTVVASGKFR